MSTRAVALTFAVQLLGTSSWANHRRHHLVHSQQIVESNPEYDCPCSNKTLCQRVTTTPEIELFGFGDQNFETYDWDLVTTLAWPSGSDVMCEAHRHNTRVIMVG